VTTAQLAPPVRRRSLLLPLALLLALALLLPFLEYVPGLHGDEAWVGMRVRALRNGYHTVYGMTPYTGSVHQYLLLPWMQLFGYHVWVLRAFTVATSLVSVLLYFLVVRRCFDARTAGIAVMLLVSMPFFTLYGRTATENFALNPLCALAACWFLLQAGDRTGRARLAFGFAAGVTLALATWSHFIFLPVPGLLVLFSLLHLRLRLFRSPVFYAAVAGFVLAISPRLIAQFVAPPEQNDLVVAAQSHKLWDLLPVRLREWPSILAGVIHGDLLYQRYTGQVLVPTPAFDALLFAFALLTLPVLASRRRIDHARNVLAVIAAVPLLFLGTLLISPENSDRYQLLVVYLAPLVLALLARPLFTTGGMPRWLPPALVASFVLFNTSRTLINFYYSHLRTGGVTSEFRLGIEPRAIDATAAHLAERKSLYDEHLAETSNHFVRTDRLYHELVARGIQGVFTEFMIAMPLYFYDLDRNNLPSILDLEDFPGRRPGPDIVPDRDRRFVITYDGGMRWLIPQQWGASHLLFKYEQFEVHSFDR
jgi:4-amino-4-deoxy-L-arabinose transferase-like glycosyltransferase